MTFALAIVPITLLLLGFPIFLVLLTAVTVALVFFMNVPLAALHQNLFGSVNATPLLAVPFFIYAGELMGRGSVAQRLVDFVQGGVGSVRGSLGVTAVGTSAIFGAISGASAATVATVGRVMVPAMRRAGYPETFTAGLITSVGAIDVIIPPSIPMIVYGAAAEESVARLYAAGVIPGLMIAAMIALYVMWRARRENFGAGEPFDRKRFLHATGRSLWALGAPVIILGGIYGGVFSPTEAAAVACVYAGFVTTFVFRELGWRDIIEASASTVLFTGQILIIVACAGVFAWLLTVNQVPATITAWLQSLNVSAWMLLLAINILLLVVGCFLDPLSAILLLSPLLVPMVKAVGINTVHFGIVVTVNLAIGLFHPPFGINIFVAQSVLGLKLETIYRGIIPFVIIYLIALALITYIPDISLIGVQVSAGQRLIPEKTGRMSSMTTTPRLLAAIAALAAGVLAAMPAGAQQFTMKLSSPTINDATHEFYKTLKAGIEQRAPRKDQGRDLSRQPARPASGSGRGRGAGHDRGGLRGKRLLDQPRAALPGARRARLVRRYPARLQNAERSGDPRATCDLGRGQGNRDSGAQPLQPADAAVAQGGANRGGHSRTKDPHAGRRADSGRSTEEAWRHSGLAAARRGVAGDAEPDDRWNGRRGGAFRCVQVLRHRQADDLSAGHLVRRAGRGQPAVA